MKLLTQASNALTPSPLIAGEYWTPRGHGVLRQKGLDAWQLILSLTGEAKLIYPEGEATILPGEMVLFAPGIKQHYVNSTAPMWTQLAFIFRAGPHWQRWLSWPLISSGIGFLRPKLAPLKIQDSLRQVVPALAETHPFRIELAMEYLHLALIRCCAEHIADSKPKIDPRIARLIEEVEMDVKKSHLPTSEMARRVGLSLPQLGRYFESQIGMSPVHFFENFRLERAAEMLRTTTLQVQEIAESVGYDDSFYFSARFRAKMGMSPRVYRQQFVSQIIPEPGKQPAVKKDRP